MSFSEWKEHRLGDICEVGSSKRIYASEYESNGIPFYRSKEVIQKARNEEISETLYISRKKYEELDEKFGSPRKGDILIASIGANMGITYYVNTDENFYFKDGNVTWLKNFCDMANGGYIYYWLTSSETQANLVNVAIGSAQKALTIDCLKKLNIKLPSIKLQEAITKILSTLDQKIEINNQINKKLEEMAQAIFKQWFVDFEFPNEDGEPYKSSGGEMVENEMGIIPKGWYVYSLYDLAEYINGTSFKKHEMSENTGVPIIKIAELKQGISNTTKYCVSNKDEKYYLINGDILFSWSGNPETSIDTFIWYRGDGVLNQHTFKVVSTKYGNEFMYLVLKHFKPIFTQIASNKQTTGLGHVTVSDLKRLKIALPNHEFMEDFLLKIKCIIRNIHTNDLENSKLINMRDILLPKLMSGEIRVPINN